MQKSRCYYCTSELTADTLRKNRLCPHCGSDLHCCRNCTQWVDGSQKCHEPHSPWISNRETHNDCPYFEMRVGQMEGSSLEEAQAEAERAKEAFRALFRGA